MAHSDQWLSAILASVIVSVLSLVGLFLLPTLSSHYKKIVFTLMICFAAGALLGDAFFHLIPETFHLIEEDGHGDEHGEDHHDEHIDHKSLNPTSPSVLVLHAAVAGLIEAIKSAIRAATKKSEGHDDEDHDEHEDHEDDEDHDHTNSIVPILCLMFGFFIFFLLESFLHSHGHSHSHEGPVSEMKGVNQGEPASPSSETNVQMTQPHCSPVEKEQQYIEDGIHPPVENVLQAPPVGLMIILSDGLHNFVDGLAIGSAFSSSINTGIATTVAIVAHEIPAELGEMAVLLSSGYPMKKAALLNLLSGSTAILGTIVGVAIGDNVENAEIYILPIVAGGFIYISCVDLMSQILNSHAISPVSIKWKLFAIWVGIAIMIGISYLE